jgi:vacuolar protein sorting-associated protein 13A/C
LDAVGTVAVVHMKHMKNAQWFNLSVVPKLGGEGYSMVKMIYIAPAYIVVNRLNIPIFLRGCVDDVGSSSVCQPAENKPFHFSPDAIKTIQLSFDDQKWSASLDFSAVGKIFCRVNDHSNVERLLRVELSLESGTCFVFVEEAKAWPFSLCNQSDFPVSFSQYGVNLVRELLPGASINYAWDEPSSKNRSIEILVYGRKKEINLNEIGTRVPFPFRLADNSKHFLAIDVVASGPVIKVVFSTFEPAQKSERSMRFMPKRTNTPSVANAASSSTTSAASGQETESTGEAFDSLEIEEEVSMVVVIRIPFVGVSFVRKDNKELLYLSCRELEVRLSRSNLYMTYGLQIKSLQIDNQMFDWQIPIIVYPAYTPLHGNAQQQLAQQQHQELQSHLKVALIKSTDQSHGIDCYSYFGFLLQETIIELGTDVIMRVNEFLSFEQPRVYGQQAFIVGQDILVIPKPPHRDPSKDSVYFELFQIHPIKLTVSSTRTEGFSEDSDDFNTFVNPFFAIQEAAASTLINFSQVPFTFNALILEHPIVSTMRLWQLVYNHYVAGFSGQLAKVLGFVDFLFNPVGLFNNLGSGVSDFFYEPYLGFVSDRPQDIGIGFLKGGFSLVRKTVFGLTDSFSKFTGSLGKGLSALTFDKSFQQRRRIDRARNRPRHALFGVVTGARQLIEGLAGGFGGLIEKPLEGAKEEGAEGFLKGMALGIAGVLSKPFVGAVDMVTSVTEGIRNSADPNVQDLQQSRLPRVIPFDGIVRKYKEREAKGQFLLYNCIGEELFKEFYMGHLEDEEGSALFITCRRVLAGRVQSGRIIWDAHFDHIYSVETEADAIVITLNNLHRKQRRIVCSRREVQDWFIERVKLAKAIYEDTTK